MMTLYFSPGACSLASHLGLDESGASYELEPILLSEGQQGNEAQAVLNAAANPYAGLLWLEFVCSPEGQKISDQYGPYAASVLTPGSVQEKAVRGLKLSIIDWNHVTKIEEYQKKIVEAYGFPRVQK